MSWRTALLWYAAASSFACFAVVLLGMLAAWTERREANR
mgnify:FL=1